jgi:iron complex outermembrane recepter protein
VRGGKLSFSKNLYNIGGIYRFGWGISAFASYSEGFGVPDVGRALRGINVPNQSLETRGNLTPLLIKNREAGINWRGSRVALGGSIYRSYSPLGSSLAYDPRILQAVVSRTPTQITGWELSAETRLPYDVSFTALYSRMIGKTSLAAGKPLNINMTADQIAPPKIVAALSWEFIERASISLTSTTYLGRHVNGGIVSTTGASLQEDFGGYTLLDMGVQYRSEHFGTWTLAAENLLDRFYIQEISSSSINQVPTGPLAYYLSGRGRMVSLSNSIKF